MPKIAIIGAGLIGRAWAMVFARAGHPVSLYDADPNALAANLAAIDASLADLARAGLIDEPPAAVRERITAAATLEEALGDAAYVQENIRETLEAKREIFAAMDRMAGPDCVLASSTSTIPASAFTTGLAGRARCLVVHPVNPPHLVPLVELSPAPWTSPETVERARTLQTAVGQVPILVRKEIQGFILNRLQAALLNEALALYADGYASAEDIDKTVRDGLGLRWSFMGPFETIDLNAPGGVADYAARYGRVIQEQVATQRPREWAPEVIGRLEAERRETLAAADLAGRERWRDRRLMALVAHKRAIAKDGSGASR
jgi:3-hydroxyacyl-CoA dehydrogenase